MILSSSSSASRLWTYNVFGKLSSIAISKCICRAERTIAPSSNSQHSQSQQQVRFVYTYVSNVQPTRHPEPLSFPEIRQAIFGDSELKYGNQSMSDIRLPPDELNLSSLAGGIKSIRVEKVRARLLQRNPGHVDSGPDVDLGTIVKDLGSGGPLEIRRRILRTYNAVVARLLSRGRTLTPYMALQGLKYAQSARSSHGVALYLDRMKTENLYLNPEEMAGILATFYERMAIESSPAEVLQQLLDALSLRERLPTGKGSVMDTKKLSKIFGAFRLRIGTVPNGDMGRVWPILSNLLRDELRLVRGSDISVGAMGSWEKIIHDSFFVARHSGIENALYDTWAMFKSSPFMSVQLKKWKPIFTKNPLGTDNESSPSWGLCDTHNELNKKWRCNSAIPKKILQLLVQHFIDQGQPSQAWKVVQESNANRALLSNETWSLLLDYSPDLPAWGDGLQNVILAKYDEAISKIESAMGLEWRGGEDGWHTASEAQSVEESLFDDSETDDSSETREQQTDSNH